MNKKKHNALKKLLTLKHNRTEKDDKQLLGLMKEWKFFNDKNLTDEEMVELIQHFDFESYKTKDCIMNLGDQGDTFYILIKGAVSVLVKNP